MPKLERGIYEKYGYPRAINISGDHYTYAASGQTRMMYLCANRPDVIAKLMPSPWSQYYELGWVQNKNEAECLRSLCSLTFIPKDHAHYDFTFANSFGFEDSMNVLLVDRLGMDLEDATRFWEAMFTKIMSHDDFQKKYAYNVRHMYGKEGARKNYTPYSCMKIIKAAAPEAGAHHGCPYK